MAQQDFDRLRLIRSAHVGPVTYARLIKRFGNAAEAIRQISSGLHRSSKGRDIRIASERDVEREIRAVESLNAKFLFLGDKNYPRLLGQLSDAPPVLIYRGNFDLLRMPAIAVVGARNASAASCRFARELADGLASKEIIVISGLARGIDTAAHQGSLQRGTIAVVAGGIDVHYPPENQSLQEEIAKRGLLVSEQPPGTEPHARHFPFRNRIIAGLALGTVVIEAAPRSGSLITARLASEAGRHVMAVPGAPYDPRSKGCNGLIREGAVLIESVDDVLELMLPMDERVDLVAPDPAAMEEAQDIHISEKETRPPTSSSRSELLPLLSMSPVAVDELVRQSCQSAADIQSALLELELTGRLQRHSGGRVSLKSTVDE